jgi:HSP20 family protein
MSLIRWNPTRELSAWPSELLSIQREMNRLFDTFARGDEDIIGLSRWAPAVDIAERDDEYLVRMELPGVRKEDVRITIENNILTIRGEKKQEETKTDDGFRRVERSYGSFQRSFTLPSAVRADKVDAVTQDGVLTVKLPKAEEARPKQIEVKVR